MAEKIKVAPEVVSCTDADGNRLHLEISIPGVKKEDIQLKMREDSFTLSAPRDDVEYVAALGFCCPVTTNGAHASYENGLLKISVPFKDPMADAVEVSVH